MVQFNREVEIEKKNGEKMAARDKTNEVVTKSDNNNPIFGQNTYSKGNTEYLTNN